MVYYIVYEEGTKYLPIGEKAFDNFWCDQGYDLLLNVVFNKPHLIDQITIKDEKNAEYSVEAFVDSLVKLNVIN